MNLKEIKINSWIDYLLITWLIMLSGNPVVIYHANYDNILASSLVIYIIITIFFRRKSILDKNIITILLFLTAIYIFQVLINSNNQLYTMIGYFIKIIIAYLTVKSVRDFLYKYINVMIFLSLLSFVFYFPSLFIDIKSFFQFLMPMPERIEHIYIHNFMIVYHKWITLDDSYRNASLFWEPAAFGGFLTLAILFLGLFHGRLSKKILTRKYIILFTALISTLSTTSYIILALLILINFRKDIFIKKRKLSILLALLPLIFFGIHQAFTHIPFLNEKISKEVDIAFSNDYNFQSTRLGGLLFDWEDIKEKPLIGWGPDPTKRPHNFEEIQYQGNGLSGYLVKFGLFGISLYIYFIYSSFSCISNKSAFFSFSATLIVLLLLNTEYYLNFPFFHTLLFFRRQHLT